MKIEVSNTADDLRDLVACAEMSKDFLVNLITGRETAKNEPSQTLDLLETWLDLHQVVGGLLFDIEQAEKLQQQTEHTEPIKIS